MAGCNTVGYVHAGITVAEIAAGLAVSAYEDSVEAYEDSSQPETPMQGQAEARVEPVAFTAMPATLTSIDEIYKVIKVAKVREIPDGSSRHLLVLKKDSRIRVTGKVMGRQKFSWYAVERDGTHLGYVWADALRPDGPARDQ